MQGKLEGRAAESLIVRRSFLELHMLKSRLWHKTHFIALPLQTSALFVTVVGVNIIFLWVQKNVKHYGYQFTLFSPYIRIQVKENTRYKSATERYLFNHVMKTSLNRELFNTYCLQSRLFLQWFRFLYSLSFMSH